MVHPGEHKQKTIFHKPIQEGIRPNDIGYPCNFTWFTPAVVIVEFLAMEQNIFFQ